jgi:hypothetical protein
MRMSSLIFEDIISARTAGTERNVSACGDIHGRALELPPPERGRVGVGVAGGKNRESEDPLPNPPPFRGRGRAAENRCLQ